MKPPEKIYLQIGDDCDKSFDGVSFRCIDGPEGHDVSWCDERIFDSDIEYVIAPRERRLKRWKEAADSLKGGEG
jgi:hypothetical protein